MGLLTNVKIQQGVFIPRRVKTVLLKNQKYLIGLLKKVVDIQVELEKILFNYVEVAIKNMISRRKLAREQLKESLPTYENI